MDIRERMFWLQEAESQEAKTQLHMVDAFAAVMSQDGRKIVARLFRTMTTAHLDKKVLEERDKRSLFKGKK